MDAINNMMVEHSGRPERYEGMDLSIGPIDVDMVVGNSTVLDLGNGKIINFIETPGHSSCALSVYIPALKAIFPTDSAPCAVDNINNLARPSPQYDFNLYRQSLKKLLDYEIEICAFEHYAAVMGTDARQVLLNGLTLCGEFEEHILSLYRETGDLEKVARQAALDFMRFSHFDFINEDIMMPVTRAVAKNILKAAGIAVV
ncbi:MAG: hypothetical protein PHQ86_09160, partial [Dehalococcoidales bacterium]|nr:hypothetical protein [Dehalococcoidales bacterium]